MYPGTGNYELSGSEILIPVPRSEFFHPRSRVKKIPDPDPDQRIEVFLTQKIVSLLSEKYDPGCSSRIRNTVR
jgi:hypothetical protein